MLNIVADVSSYLLLASGKGTNMLYNYLIPIERVLTLVVYICNEYRKRNKRLHLLGIFIIIGISVLDAFTKYDNFDFHHLSNVFTGILLAALSYIHLRSVSLNKAGQSVLIFYFGLANLIYLTLMVCAMSALPLALQISLEMANNVYSINLFGYGAWAVIIILGMLWKKQ